MGGGTSSRNPKFEYLNPKQTDKRYDDTAAVCIADIVSSVMYHAERDKGKCDLHGVKRQGLVEWEGQNQPEIELNDATVASYRIKS